MSSEAKRKTVNHRAQTSDRMRDEKGSLLGLYYMVARWGLKWW